MKYTEKKVYEFLEGLSSHAPVPGGGSAAALVGALGVSLLGMVAHFTLGKKGYEKSDSEIKKILLESYRMRDRLSRLVDGDIESYQEVSRAQRAAKVLTKKESREKLLRKALRKALASSLNICKVSHRGIRISERLAKIGNTGLRSDAKAACFFLFASFQAAFLMSEANAKWLKDDSVFQKMERVLLPLRDELERTMKEIQREK